MGAKITVGAIEITVAVSELGEALKQLSPWLPSRAEAPPRPGGAGAWPFPTGVDDQRPTKAQRPAQAELPTPMPRPAQVGSERPSQIRDGNANVPQRALALFKALRDHRASGGMAPEEIMALVGTEHPKGIGNRMQAINAFIRTKGLDPNDVYSNARSDAGKRVWVACAGIDAAIEAIQNDQL